MITRSVTDTGRTLVPEVNPGFAVQLGPYEDQVEMKFPSEKPLTGSNPLPLEPALNAAGDARPAQPLDP